MTQFTEWSCFGVHLNIDSDDTDEDLPWQSIQVTIPQLEFVLDETCGIVYRDDQPFYQRQTLSSQLEFVLKYLKHIPLDQLSIEIRWGQSEPPIMTRFKVGASMRGSRPTFSLTDIHNLWKLPGYL